MLIHQSHAVGEENGSIMLGMFVCLCLASKKASEREFFVPAGTDLGVQLLTRGFVSANMLTSSIQLGLHKRRLSYDFSSYVGSMRHIPKKIRSAALSTATQPW